MKQTKNKSIYSLLLFLLFLAFIAIIKTIDVQPIGPMGTRIGLASLNMAFNKMTGQNLFLYKITEITGIIAILVAGIYTFAGFIQLIRKRSIFEVDEEILCRGVIYAIVIVVYAFFEKIIINYRPVIMPGEVLPEASFPSSHTMLVCCIMGCTILSVERIINNFNIAKIIKVLSLAIIIITVLGRLFCGVHWLTDIIGGIIISASLVLLYSYLIDNAHLSNKIR